MQGSEEGSRQLIKDLLARYVDSYVARDLDGFASCFTEDAVWMPPDQPPLAGKAAWVSWLSGNWDEIVVEEVRSASQEIVIAGEWAYEWHIETQVRPGRRLCYKGIILMQRQTDGAWKIARYCFNRSPETGAGEAAA